MQKLFRLLTLHSFIQQINMAKYRRLVVECVEEQYQMLVTCFQLVKLRMDQPQQGVIKLALYQILFNRYAYMLFN